MTVGSAELAGKRNSSTAASVVSKSCSFPAQLLNHPSSYVSMPTLSLIINVNTLSLDAECAQTKKKNEKRTGKRRGTNRKLGRS